MRCFAHGLPGEALAGAPDHVRVRRHPADIIRRLERGVSPADNQHGLVREVGRVDGHLGVGRDELGAADLGDLGDREALVVQQVLSFLNARNDLFCEARGVLLLP